MPDFLNIRIYFDEKYCDIKIEKALIELQGSIPEKARFISFEIKAYIEAMLRLKKRRKKCQNQQKK